MGGASKTFALTVTAVSWLVIMVILVVWVGPSVKGIPSRDSTAVLFDEQQVQRIYQRVGPAVAGITTYRQIGWDYVQTGFGTGFLIDKEGHIVTNNHVIEDSEQVRVQFPNTRPAIATILGRNPANDLALLKVGPEVIAEIEPVQMADSSMVRPGQLAIAIGNPFQLGGSITAGVISGVDRYLPNDLGQQITGVIQTDALIGPGNSGGPLLNSGGYVVGITTAMAIPDGLSGRPNAGFAVPANNLMQVLPRLKVEHLVQPSWLGVSGTDVNEPLVERLGLPVHQGVYVTGIAIDSPAQAAGIIPSSTSPYSSGFREGGSRKGDIIVAVSGVPVRSTLDLASQLNLHQPGNVISLKILRDDVETELLVTLGEWPEEQWVQVTRPSSRKKFPDSPRESRVSPTSFLFHAPHLPVPAQIPANSQR